MFKHYNVPEWLIALGLVLFSLFPSYGYFSMRFGTVNTILFFAALSVALALKNTPSTPAGLVKVSLALAAAGAVKLSGLFIAPITLWLVWQRMSGTIAQKLKALIMPGLIGLITLVLGTNPALISFHPTVIKTYTQIMAHFIAVTKLTDGAPNIWIRFYDGVFNTPAIALIMGFLALGLVLAKPLGKDRWIILAGIAVTSVYLMQSVLVGFSIGIYITAVSFLLALGVIGINQISLGSFRLGLWNKLTALLLSGLIILGLWDISYRANAYAHNPATLFENHAAYYVKQATCAKDMADAEAMRLEITRLSGGKPRHIFMDFTAPMTINPLTYEKGFLSVAWNNFSPVRKYYLHPVDFIVLDKQDSIGFKSQAQFNNSVAKANPQVAQQMREDRANRLKLVEQGLFDGQAYHQVKIIGRLMLFSQNKHVK